MVDGILKLIMSSFTYYMHRYIAKFQMHRNYIESVAVNISELKQPINLYTLDLYWKKNTINNICYPKYWVKPRNPPVWYYFYISTWLPLVVWGSIGHSGVRSKQISSFFFKSGLWEYSLCNGTLLRLIPINTSQLCSSFSY